MVFLPAFLWKFWSGQYSLAVSFWLFGLIGWSLVTMALVASILMPSRAMHLGNQGWVLTMALTIIYTAFAMVGIWRSATDYERARGSSIWPTGAKFAVLLFAGVYLRGLVFNGGFVNLLGLLTSSN
jgi:hypothetical protein